MKEHNADPGQIEAICMDMSPSSISGAREFFPKAERIFDPFPLMQMAGGAVDQVRKEFGRQGLLPKGSLWTLRGNEWTRSEEQKGLRSSLCAADPRLGRAIGLREALQEILSQEDPQELRWWFRWADRSRLAPFRRLSKTIKEHLGGIISSLLRRNTNGTIEAINGLIQLAKRMARGFRSFRYLRIAAFLKAGKLQLDLPALPTCNREEAWWGGLGFRRAGSVARSFHAGSGSPRVWTSPPFPVRCMDLTDPPDYCTQKV